MDSRLFPKWRSKRNKNADSSRFKPFPESIYQQCGNSSVSNALARIVGVNLSSCTAVCCFKAEMGICLSCHLIDWTQRALSWKSSRQTLIVSYSSENSPNNLSGRKCLPKASTCVCGAIKKVIYGENMWHRGLLCFASSSEGFSDAAH